MKNWTRIKAGLIFAALIFLAAVFLFFNFPKNGKPKNIASQNYTPAENQTKPSGETELPKTMPTAIPILMYHYIRDYSNPNDPVGENLSVSPSQFEEQINWLKVNGYQSVFPDFFENPKPLALKPVILTFDDGYQDAYDSAFPLLQKYQMAGMFYLIVNKIGTPGYLTWNEILEMKKAGMSFGSHTLTHPDLRNLTNANLEKEMNESKEILEQKLGREITDFCYPSGKYNDEIMKIVQSDGYKTAVTTDSGIANLKDNPLLLKRLRISENTSFQTILSK